jgi:hypothetical protein
MIETYLFIYLLLITEIGTNTIRVQLLVDWQTDPEKPSRWQKWGEVNLKFTCKGRCSSLIFNKCLNFLVLMAQDSNAIVCNRIKYYI